MLLGLLFGSVVGIWPFQQAVEHGQPRVFYAPDLGQIVAGKKTGRESDDERTISINLGLALDDMATAIRIYRKAVQQGIGRQLPL